MPPPATPAVEGDLGVAPKAASELRPAPVEVPGPDVVRDFRAYVAQHGDRLDVETVDRALRFAERAHRGQKRASGEDFVTHTVAVAQILAEQLLDTTSIVAALLHDVVEDSEVRAEEIAREFGPEVGEIVEGLTKISHLAFRSTAEEQVENYRKLLLSIARDARVIIIKLADRLHNMRTLDPFAPEKQRRIATETREIYAPLAHRFGMAGVKAELEDLAFKFLEPDDYRALVQHVQAKRAVREQMILKLRTPLEYELRIAGVAEFEVTGRPKHLWSIYQKMKKRGKGFEDIYDLMAVRVIVPSIAACYHVLGVIHHVWTPLQERIKDYIASPKSNGYQSLHTTIFGPGGNLYEVQIRTQEMHKTAEFGIAAHWVYKKDGKPDELDRHLSWFRQLLELQQDTHSPEEFLEFLKIDLYQDEIFIFTPKGDVKRLPKGSTPIDFAFHVHTNVGFRTQGAKINGRIAPLHRELKNGDTVEILTGPNAKPSRDWLSHVRTARARHKIKQWVKQEEEKVSQQLGHEILERELKRRRLDVPSDERRDAAASALGLTDAASLDIAIGRGDIALGLVVRQLYPDLPAEALVEQKPTAFGRVIDRIRLGRGIRIQGVDGLMVRYAQCCQPVPGDRVVGYVTQGRGISIHREDCPNLLTLQADDRRVEIDWEASEGESFAVQLAVTGDDRRGLYADIMSAISATGTNIRGADLHTRDGAIYGNVFVEVENLPHLGKVLKAIRRVKGVGNVERREATGAH
ncbi:MAG: bifunctional (p)ppGpp synthetase/guanosine-3',5'-bis(diphosphate) 3'-pyrophosphohydrolase [Gemmatimonadales bacterium]|nr:bifunctional (p)ppGpp synthetase/guanosine-3',5'-bis(diphosphate) 3'-pyrophosphohydrolase [Gemmatimonadales bacterium]